MSARRKTLLLLALVTAMILALVSCSSSPESPDGSPEIDSGAGPEAAPDADATVGAPDATVGPDATPGPDATVGPDATAPPDATVGADSTVGSDSAPGPDATDASSTNDALPTEDVGPTTDATGGDSASTDAGADAMVPASATVGASGGTLVHPLGARLVVPAGALTTSTLLTLTPIAAPTGATIIGTAFRLDPPALTFASPVTITLAYAPSSVPGGTATSSLGVELSTDTGVTFTALSSTQDTVGDTVSASTMASGELAPIVVSAGALFITSSTTLVAGTTGTAYSTALTASGGVTPYTWSTTEGTSAPPGLTLTASGVLSGTPTTVGSYSFFVRVADSSAHATQTTVTLAVNPPNNPAPTLSSISPSGANQGTPTNVTLTGTGFVPSTVALLGSATVATTYVSATEVIAALSASNLAAAGSFTIAAMNPPPGGGTSAGLTFTVTGVAQNPSPFMNQLTPPLTPVGSADTQITITGIKFVPTSVVLANGATIASSYVSATQLLAILPTADLQDAGTVTVTVTNPPPGGGNGGSLPFAVGGNANGTPIVTSVAPAATDAGAPITITLTGSGFVYENILQTGLLNPIRNGYVIFDNYAIATTYVSSTQVTGTIHKALIQSPHTASVTYTNTGENGALGNALPFEVLDGGSPPNCVAAGYACGGGNVSHCCSGTATAPGCICLATCYGLGPISNGAGWECCTNNLSNSVCQ